jgi:hypothetical protein
MAEFEARRAVEALAQALYEASDPGGTPWVRRNEAVREPWLRLARQQLAQSGNRSQPDREVGP